MATVTPRSLPEQGQIVTVRHRLYVVAVAPPSALPSPEPTSLAASQHQILPGGLHADRLLER